MSICIVGIISIFSACAACVHCTQVALCLQLDYITPHRISTPWPITAYSANFSNLVLNGFQFSRYSATATRLPTHRGIHWQDNIIHFWTIFYANMFSSVLVCHWVGISWYCVSWLIPFFCLILLANMATCPGIS